MNVLVLGIVAEQIVDHGQMLGSSWIRAVSVQVHFADLLPHAPLGIRYHYVLHIVEQVHFFGARAII